MVSRKLDLKNLTLRLLRLGNRLPPPWRGAFLWRLFCTPFVHSRGAEQIEFLKSGKPLFLPFQDYLLPAWVYGRSGPTVALCHGWQGSAASWFKLTPILLEAGFRVIIFNAPGHHNRPRCASLPLFTGALQTVLDTFPVDYLVGHSFGGMTSARLTAQGYDLKKLVLISSPNQLSALAHGFCHNMRMAPDTEKDFFRRLDESFGHPTEFESVVHYFQTIQTPTLLIHDHDDDVIPIETSQTVAAEHGLELVETNSLGHRQIIRDVGVCERVRDFLLG